MQNRQSIKSKGKFFIKRKKTAKPIAPANEKGSFPNYMRKEIFTQPQLIDGLLERYIRADKIDFDFLKIKIDKIKRIYIVGSSEDYGCVLAGAYNFEVLVDIPAIPVLMSEFIYSNPILDKSTLVIVIGNKTNEHCNAVINRANTGGARIIAVFDFDTENGYAISLDFNEKGAVSTAGYSLKYITISLLALYFGEKNQVVTELYIKIATKMLRSLGDKIKYVLESEYLIKHILQKTDENRLLLTGTNVDFASAIYGAHLLSFAYSKDIYAIPASELKNLKRKSGNIIGYASNESFYDILVKSANDCLQIIPKNIKTNTVDFIDYDDTIPLLNPVLGAVVTQLMAYNIAIDNKIITDKQ
ncbi:MAG: SIS domain-containing protein [Eubacterium sp.]|nr:SIS domain-containing protein [Eubacterium sp.]